MTMNNPLVSVVLPVYNGERFLQDTLESISAQHRDDIEVVIIDDGSADSSWDIVSRWRHEQPFLVHAVRKPSNYGVCAALTDATSIATGRYIAQIGHDDVWLPGHLTKLVDALELAPTAVAAFADVGYIDATGMPADVSIFNHEQLRNVTRPKLFSTMLKGNFLCAPASMFRRECFDRAYWGISNERLQDFELWLNLLFEGDFVSSNAPTCLYRVHGNNLSSGSQMRRQSEYELLATFTRVLLGKRFGTFYRSIADEQERMTFLSDAHECLLKVTEYAPAIRALHSILLESLVLVEVDVPAQVHALRGEMALRLGMYRKFLAISKTFPAHYMDAAPAIPYLVPVHAGVGEPFRSLVEAGAFRDGSCVDLQRERAVFFFACKQEEIEAHTKYPVFAEAIASRRVIVFDADETRTVDAGLALARNANVEHALIDKIYRFFEEDHGSFAHQLGWRRVEGQMPASLLRRIYHRSGAFVPERYRPVVAAGIRRLLRRR
ncbi:MULTISPECIES: glycosyltransferase [unclassified Caballeronia]|uniref:glycosyltransferase n=1 Tax=unclassified Caballeronia TaxID=2646786 RepID=UPI0028653010|nr:MULTISPECIES: glycosyltransferase [unclassified Caballeronia]MDR5751445.1 glycosyltransferase [Caballeronia sp. LZ024]MDR5844414.1 glycosyltransferase [Caballeronia sp. LZ031]